MGLICIFLVTNNVEHLFIQLWAILYAFFSIQVLCPIFNRVACFSTVEVYECFIHFGYWLLIRDMVCKHIFSQSIGCCFMFWLFPLLCRSFLVWCSNIFYLLLYNLRFWYSIQISLPRPVSRNFPPVLSSRNVMVSGLTFNSFIYFELIFAYGIKIQFYSFAYGNKVFLVLFIKETILSQLCSLGALVKT